jgi:dienelactone hydrolase
MSKKQQCCPTDVKPSINDYKGVGSRVTLDGHFDMYVTGTGNSTQAIVLVYDIFGWTNNAEQLADALARNGNFLVVVPDFMKGQAWDPSNIPPTRDGKFPVGVDPEDGLECLLNWIMTHPTCKVDRADEVKAVKEYLVKNHSITKLGLVGLCWGGKVCFVAANKENNNLVDAVATCHGSFLGAADVEAVDIPVCLLNSKEEPETYRTEVKPVLDRKAFASKNVYKDFPSMHHGWMGTRGVSSVNDFEQNKELCERYREGVTDLVNFFIAAFAG